MLDEDTKYDFQITSKTQIEDDGVNNNKSGKSTEKVTHSTVSLATVSNVTFVKQEKNSSDRPSVTLSYNTNVISPKTMTGVYAFEDGSDKTAYVGINNNTIIIDDVTPGIRKFDIVPFLQVANGSTNILYFGVFEVI